MMQGTKGWTCASCIAALLIGCGGKARPADSPGTCPEGTVLRGSDCLPASGTENTTGSEPASSASPQTGDSSPPPSGSTASGTPYDKDAVEAELKRAARAVKASCGAATDDDGEATGPWGTTKASITLGRNGHVRHVAVPPPYDGKPVGVCIVDAFNKIWFPPYAGSSDAVVDWEVELVKPSK